MDVLSGGPLDIGELTPTERENLVLILAHCCMNGPVGVRKATSFPGNLNGRICDMFKFSNKVTNKNWKAVCNSFAVLLKGRFPRVVSQCEQVRRTGDVWPLNEISD